MWFLIHQRAQDIIAERERQAAHVRLEHLVAAGRVPPIEDTTTDAVRRVAARVTLAFARGAYRLARAIDAEIVGA
jgi:hypothetical protein